MPDKPKIQLPYPLPAVYTAAFFVFINVFGYSGFVLCAFQYFMRYVNATGRGLLFVLSAADKAGKILTVAAIL